MATKKMSIREINQQVEDLLFSVRNSCIEGLDGTWDCSTDEGRESFEPMADDLDEIKELLSSKDKKIDDLIHWAKCALLDLAEVMPEFEPSGDREHPGWKSIKGLNKAIKKIDSTWKNVNP